MIRLFICLTCTVLFLACHTKKSEVVEAEKVSKKVATQFIPDNREDLFQIKFRSGGSNLIVEGETTNQEARKILLSRLKNSKITVIDSIKILPDLSLGLTTWGLVNISVCNIRSGPAHSAEMVTQAILGTPVRILKKSNHWSFIQTPDRYLGWVDDDALSQKDSLTMAAWRNNKRIVYLPLIGAGFNPETKVAVTDIVAGSILALSGTTKSELILEMPDGRKLTIPAADGMEINQWKNRAEPTPAVVSDCAKTLMGRPYLWGGTSTKGADCSGFVKTVFFLNGIILARDASLQFRHGAKIEPQSGYEKLKEGDLVFFGRKAEGDRPAKATHVGLYLGNGEYINSSGFVRIDSFDPIHKNYSKIRADNWLGGRTILGSEGTPGIVRIKDHPWY